MMECKHRMGYNPFLNANFCQDCGVCDCPEHNMIVMHSGQPSLAGVEDYIPPERRFIRTFMRCGNPDIVLESIDRMIAERRALSPGSREYYRNRNE